MRRHWEDKQQRCYFIRKTTNVTDRIGTLSYLFICDTLWRRSGAHVKHLYHFVLSFSTAVQNNSYHDSKTLNTIVVCIGLIISLHGDYQALFCLIIYYSISGVRQRWYMIHSEFFWSNRWGSMVKSVGHWVSYGLKQGNPLQN